MTTGFSVLGWKGENGGFRKRLLYGSVFVKHTSPFSIVLVWTEFENKHKKNAWWMVDKAVKTLMWT